MAKSQKTGHGGDRKHGRNKVKCALYRQFGRRDTNKEKKISHFFRGVLKEHLKHGKTLSVKGFNAMRSSAKDMPRLMKILEPITARATEA